jgi:GH25 family lysozyme M1 (1,4-beta-N-acetylmuramidase)
MKRDPLTFSALYGQNSDDSDRMAIQKVLSRSQSFRDYEEWLGPERVCIYIEYQISDSFEMTR